MKKRSKLKTLVQMLGLVRPLAGWMLLAIAAGTAGYLAIQFLPILGGYAILYGLHMEIPIPIQLVAAALPILAVLRAVLRYTEQRTNHYIAFTLLALIRDRVFRALRRLCPAKLEGRDKGDLISLITSDVELLEVFYAHTISPICIALLVELVMCLFIGSFHWVLGLLALCAYIGVGVVLPILSSNHSGSIGERLRVASGELAAYVLENLRGIEETLQYQDGKNRLDGMNERTNRLSEQQGSLNRMSGLNLALANTLIYVFDLLMLFLGLYLYYTNRIGFDGLLVSFIALASSYGPVSALASLGTTLQSTIAAGGRVLDLLEEKPETDDIFGQEEIGFSGAECQNVTFGYGKDTVLKDLSLRLPKNRIIGIKGKSGSGKSTLLKLLMRFWRVNAGSVEISGKNIEQVNTANLRRLEGYMTQDTQIFQDTIANNIRIGKLDATQQEIEEACRKASIHEFIMTLPRQYETQAGELGEMLSGGERQRIGLARAFLHDAPLLLLDEPTSNLDSLNEAAILKAIKEETGDRTVVLVSHRESTLRIAGERYEVEQAG